MMFKYSNSKQSLPKRMFMLMLSLLLLLCLSSLATITLAEDDENKKEEKKEKQTGDSVPSDGQNEADENPSDASSEAEENKEENKRKSEPKKAIERVSITNKQKVSKRHSEVLKHLKLYNRENELIELNAEDESFYGFFLQERTGKPQGAVLILHDIEQHGHWPKLVAPLRESLPDSGWITLSIELPHRPSVIPAYKLKPASKADSQAEKDNTAEQNNAKDGKPETNSDNTEAQEEPKSETEEAEEDATQQDNAANTDNEPELPKLDALPPLPEKEATQKAAAEEPEDVMQAYRDSVKSRINSALEYLRNRGQFNLVIIGSGEAAIWAADTMLNLDKKEGLALVMVNAKSSPAQDALLIEKIADIELPILDLITSDNKSQKLALKLRKGEMRHRNKSDYSQILLSQNAGYADAFEPLEAGNYPAARRIRGWLKSKAAGTALKIPRSQAQ